MRVSSRLAGWAVAASVMLAAAACEAVATAPSEPAAGRPAGASEGLRAAIVVAVHGGATIKPSQGAPFIAGPDQELLADDTVITSGDGFVMLELHNGHIVRVRSGEGLRVDKTAAFREPAAAGALADRLAAALSADETSDPRLQVAARVAGWNMRMSSARTFGVQETLDRGPPPPPAIETTNVELDVRASAGAAPATDPPGGEAPEDDAKQASSKKSGQTQRGRLENKNGGDPPQPQPVPTRRPDDGSSPLPDPVGSTTPSKQSKNSEPESEPILDLPGSVDFVPDGGAKRRVGLPGPLLQQRNALASCAGKGVQIRAQIKGGKLVKLEFPGADKCGAGILGKTIALEDGWLELRVKS
jgi:hypothetical protein